MTELVYGVSTFERRRGGFPALPVINMLAEAVPTEPATVLQSRPGLEKSGTELGANAVRGLYTADGVLNNSLFAVSGTNLYADGVLVGAIDGTGPVSFAGYEDFVFINAGAGIWSYNGTTLAQVPFPDNAPVSKIVVGASRIIAVRATTGQFYWSDPLSSTIGALSFATAENSPDTLKDTLFLGDKLIHFGAETIEFWPVSGEADLPFVPLVGAVLPVGIKATGTAVHFNRTFAWVTNNNEVCVGDPDNIISEPELQVKISESANVSLWTFYVDDNEYLAAQTDSVTWVFGARSQVWSEFQTYGQDNWIAQCYDGGYFGSSIDGNILRWSDGYTDLGQPLERRFRAWVPLTAEVLKLKNVVLRTNPGTTPFLTGDFTDPSVELRTSRDGGKEWQPWKSRRLGEQGQYRKKTFWSSLGQFNYPGVLLEVRYTAPTPFRVSGMSMNEPFGGR